MWHELTRWCGAAPGYGFIDEWNVQRADRAAEWTEHYDVGQVVSPPRIVGNRRIEAIIADRERRLHEMRLRQLAAGATARVA